MLRQKMLDWQKWSAWCATRSIVPDRAVAHEVSQFLAKKKRGTVAARFWDALRWAQSYLQAQLVRPR